MMIINNNSKWTTLVVIDGNYKAIKNNNEK